MATQISSNKSPLFADEVMVSFVIKTSRESNEKDAAVRMSFIDSMRKSVVSEIVVSPITAGSLSNILTKTLAKLDDAKKGKLVKTPKKEDETTYIG
ncbi:MAG: hypothetical protein GOV01_02160 [Candidatus Altiarchaeota archaeon]|nr:hypothetical protein [Candidatus Altiarchaeota archaeon]